MRDGESLEEEVANAEAGCVVSEKGVNPGTDMRRETIGAEYRYQLGRVEVVVKARDVEEQ